MRATLELPRQRARRELKASLLIQRCVRRFRAQRAAVNLRLRREAEIEAAEAASRVKAVRTGGVLLTCTAGEPDSGLFGLNGWFVRALRRRHSSRDSFDGDGHILAGSRDALGSSSSSAIGSASAPKLTRSASTIGRLGDALRYHEAHISNPVAVDANPAALDATVQEVASAAQAAAKRGEEIRARALMSNSVARFVRVDEEARMLFATSGSRRRSRRSSRSSVVGGFSRWGSFTLRLEDIVAMEVPKRMPKRSPKLRTSTHPIYLPPLAAAPDSEGLD